MAKKPIPTVEESLKSFEAYEEALRIERETRWNTLEELDMIEKNSKAAYKALIPREGLKCSMIFYSDVRACIISKVYSASKVGVMHLKTKCLDWYASHYEIFDEIDPTFSEAIFTKRSNGYWVQEGQPSKDGVLLALNYCRHYIDPSF